MDGIAIGIDLGTTNSCVGVFRNGKVEIIANDQGSRTTPSYVAFTDVEILIGDSAKKQFTRNLRNTVYDVKRLMGRKFDDDTVQADVKHWPFQVIDDNNNPKIKIEIKGTSKTYTPEEVSSKVLRRMKETAEAYLGETVKNAVITVPAYFNDSQRQATKDAAKIAGLNALRIINEPTAAALAYGLEKKDTGLQNVLIFDLGGGTFDVSILTIQDGIFEVISTAGDTHLGGEDFDNIMVNYFVEEIKRKCNEDITNNERALNLLRTACEGAKRTLSSATVAYIEIVYGSIDFSSSISRVCFEELNSAFFQRMMKQVEKAITDATINKNQIDHVVLVGGSSRIPKIRKLLQDFFDGKELNKSINPDEAVAYGAAVQAAILNGDESNEIQDIVLFDVTPMSLGIGSKADHNEMFVIIKRNTPIPARHTETRCTMDDNQTNFLFKVYEGEYASAKKNHWLGEFTLMGIPRAPAGKGKADVTFEIDANGILNVTAVETSTGNTNQLAIKYDKGRLSNDEIERMIEDAEKLRIEEETRKAASVAKDALESYCVNVKSVVQDEKLKNQIDKFDRDTILKKCEETIAWLNSDLPAKKDMFERKLKELQTFDTIISIARCSNAKNEKYCEMLNVSKGASQDEIKKAYREKASKYHPDKYKGDKEVGTMQWLTFGRAKDYLISLASGMLFRKN